MPVSKHKQKTVKRAKMSSGKKAKKQNKKLSLNEFLGGNESTPTPQYVKSTSWADEVDEGEAELEPTYATSLINRSALPTAPRAARGPNVDMDKVPTSPPFTAYLGNLPFEVTVEDIERFFQKLQVTNVRLVEDRGRAKGYGYAQFASRQDLVEALSMDDNTMRNRSIRINLPEGRPGERDDRGGGGRRRNDDFPDRTTDDWRSKPDGPRDDGPPRDRRGGGGDRYGGDRYSDRRGGDRYGDDRRGERREEEDSGPWRRGGDGGGGSRESYGGEGRYGRDGDREGGRSFGSGYRDERKRYSPPRDRFGGGRRDGGYGRRDDDRDGRPAHDDTPKERPKLQLQKRTKPLEEEKKEPEQRSSIFGGAKPVDTLSKELKIEEKIAHLGEAPRKEEAPKRVNVFGSAKPVDTAAREREIEEKLLKERSTSEKPRDKDRSEGRKAGDRPRRDSDQPRRDSDRTRRDSADTESSRDHRRGSSGKGSVSSPESKPSGSRVSDEASVSDSQPPTSPTQAANFVPAPPPKENPWSRRKEQTFVPTSPPAPQTQASKKTPSDESSKKETSGSKTAVDERENTAPGGPPVVPSKDIVPAKPPTENAWRKPPQVKTDTQQQRQPASKQKPEPRKQNEERPPKTLEDMPKLQETRAKDFSVTNKFSTLLADEDDNGDSN